MARITFLLSLIWNLSNVSAAESPLVAVASNMTHAITEISEQFQQENDIDVRLIFGSSGNFSRQIIQGAPYQIFLSADKQYIDVLNDNGHPIKISTTYTRGRIGVFVPNDSHIKEKTDLNDIVKSLFHGQYRRIAIANPEHAPYGKAAEQALHSAGLWAIEQDKLLIGENAAQTMQFTLSGGVELGIVPLSYALLPEISDKGRFYLIPQNWHEPIQQYLVLFQNADQAAKKFYDYLLSATSTTVLKKYGYELGTEGTN